MSESAPTTNGGANGHANGNGRNGNGRFVKGNPGGPGNPHAAEVGRMRARFYAKLRDSDIDAALGAIRRVLKKAEKDCDRLAAARELLDRVLGKAVQQDLLERLEALEAAVGGRRAK